MQIIKIINQVVAFSLEMAMLVALGYCGFQSGKTLFWKYVFAIVLPLIAAILWGLFAAPKADYRLELAPRILFELTLFLATAIFLYKTGYKTQAIIFGGMSLLSVATAYFLKQ